MLAAIIIVYNVLIIHSQALENLFGCFVATLGVLPSLNHESWQFYLMHRGFLNSHHFIKVLDAGAHWQIGMNEWIFQPMLAVIRNLWMLIARHIPVLHYVIHSLEQWDLPLSLSLVKVAKHRVVEAHAAVGLWLVVSYVQSLQAAVRMCEQEDWQIIVLGQSFLMEAQGVFQQLLVPLMVAGLALAPPVPPVVHGQELITLLCKFLG